MSSFCASKIWWVVLSWGSFLFLPHSEIKCKCWQILQGTFPGEAMQRRPLGWHLHWWCPLQPPCPIVVLMMMTMKRAWRTSRPQSHTCPRPSRHYAPSSLQFSSEVSSLSSYGGWPPARSSALCLASTSTSTSCRTKWGVLYSCTCNTTSALRCYYSVTEHSCRYQGGIP